MKHPILDTLYIFRWQGIDAAGEYALLVGFFGIITSRTDPRFHANFLLGGCYSTGADINGKASVTCAQTLSKLDNQAPIGPLLFASTIQKNASARYLFAFSIFPVAIGVSIFAVRFRFYHDRVSSYKPASGTVAIGAALYLASAVGNLQLQAVMNSFGYSQSPGGQNVPTEVLPSGGKVLSAFLWLLFSLTTILTVMIFVFGRREEEGEGGQE